MPKGFDLAPVQMAGRQWGQSMPDEQTLTALTLEELVRLLRIEREGAAPRETSVLATRSPPRLSNL